MLPPSHALRSRVQSMTCEMRHTRAAPEGTAVLCSATRPPASPPKNRLSLVHYTREHRRPRELFVLRQTPHLSVDPSRRPRRSASAADSSVHGLRQDSRCRLIGRAETTLPLANPARWVHLPSLHRRFPGHPTSPSGQQPAVGGPSRPLTFGDQPTSSRLPPSTLSVGYGRPPENQRAPFSTAAKPWPPSPLHEERSVSTASLGLGRDEVSPRLPRSLALRGSGHDRGRHVLPPPRGGADDEHECARRCSRELHRRSLDGIVRSGQSDIEATSGAELVSPRVGGPTCSRFTRLCHRTLPHVGQAETHPRRERRATRRDPATNHRTTRTRQSQVGRNRQTPQQASEVIGSDDRPLPACCLTRNPTAPATSIFVHSVRGPTPHPKEIGSWSLRSARGEDSDRSRTSASSCTLGQTERAAPFTDIEQPKPPS